MSKPCDPNGLRLLGAAIRERRVAIDLSQEQLAERIGCHRNYVGYVERGEYNPSYASLRRFAAGFKCAVSELIRPAD